VPHELAPTPRPQDLTRAAFLRRVAAVGVSTSAFALLAGCGEDDNGDGGTANGGAGTGATTLEDLGTVGGTIQVITYAGYEGGDAIKPWLKETGVKQDLTPINNQDDVTTRLRSPAGKTADAAQLGVAQVAQYQQLGLAYPINEEWLTNAAEVEPYFLDLTRDPDGNLTSVPFVWGALGCNYDPEKMEPITSWEELTEPRFKGRIAMIDDPVSTVQTGALALGIREPHKMTRDQLEQVKEFLLRIKANARTVAAGYADIGDLIVQGDVWASFQGWNAVEIFASGKDGTVKTAYPDEGTVGFVDTFLVPKDSDNKRTGIAFIDQMLSEEMQVYVGTDLASGLVRTSAAGKVKGVGAEVFDYDNLKELFETKFVFALDAPIESEGDVASHEDWVTTWEDVKAA
jgi:spermidine/putrescine-binding protein